MPPMSRELIQNVDATPDENYVMRILKAHLGNAMSRYEAVPPSPFWDKMNELQSQRQALLEEAIARLEGNHEVTTTP